MSTRIRQLEISGLNERLSELEDLRDAVKTAKEEVAEASQALEEFRAAHDVDTETEEYDKLTEAVSDAEKELSKAQNDFPTDEQEELTELEALKDEIGERHGRISNEGGPFIHENDFVDYARDLAEDIGAIDPNAGWPLGCIDWEQAADELKSDYSTVTYQGSDYYYRSC